MLGKILSYDEETQTGAIQIQRSVFEFNMDHWQGDEAPKVEDDVFVNINSMKNKILEVVPAGDYLPKGDPVKSKIIAALLGIFLGLFGAGRFYLGYYKIGILQMVITIATLGVGVIWPFVDGIMILTGNVMKDAQGRPLK